MVIDAIVSALGNNPVLVSIVVLLLAFVFFIYLFLRRTVTAFKEGYE